MFNKDIREITFDIKDYTKQKSSFPDNNNDEVMKKVRVEVKSQDKNFITNQFR